LHDSRVRRRAHARARSRGLDALDASLSERLDQPPRVEIIVAGRSDLAVASSILTEAAEWLRRRGDPLWQPHELVPERLLPQVENRTLHIGRVGDEPVATIVFQWRDRLFWPDDPPGEAAYVHRLAVQRRVAGTGVAAACLSWAEKRSRDAGRSWLRLDCSADHPGLCRYYEAAGFARHSAGTLGASRFVRYQKRLR
jgi:GNAT superfamily N-acetyltransferase